MKTITTALLICINSICFSQNQLSGAWQLEKTDDKGREIIVTAIVSENHASDAIYLKASGEFIGTFGGSYSLNGNIIKQTIEFDSQNPERVGTVNELNFSLEKDQLTFKESGETWYRVDAGTPGQLAGAWLISGRMRDGEIRERTPGPRKTMKILSGSRFQWIAYNTETKEFMGTGGGTYTTVDGKYTENIGFFSRDDSRVGASLGFKYELKDGKWHHSGKSSKGKDIYEVWKKR